MQHIAEEEAAHYKLAKWINRNCSFIKTEYNLQKKTPKPSQTNKQNLTQENMSGAEKAEQRGGKK